jgi:protein phosphatase
VTPRDRTPAYAGASDTGRVRSGNEDALLLAPPLFAVADGLGGHQAGEVASRIAVDTLLAEAPRKADSKALGRAARAANRAVIDAAAQGRGRAGMGTTLTAVMLDGLRIAVAHVGDSRAYLMRRDGRLERITEDHSMVADLVRQGSLTEEESRVHPNRSVITRALGSDPNMVPDTFDVMAEPGDRLLLCTDGLSSLVSDDELADILSRHQEPTEAVNALIAAAQLAGGYDNITAVVVDLAGGAHESGTASRRPAGPRALLWVLAVAALLVMITGGVYQYAASRAFLIEENGVVAVYRGVPGAIGGFRLHWLEQMSDVPVADLSLQEATQLRQGVTTDSLDQAYAMLASYRVEAARNRALPTSTPAPMPPTGVPTTTPPATGAP